MLRRFLYLQEKALNGYLSAVEGGIADGVVRHQSSRGAASGHVTVGAHGFGGAAALGRDKTEEATSSLRETPEQRFDRLIRLLDESPETYLYEEVIDLQDAFPRLVVGSFISVDCDLEIPAPIRLLAQPEAMSQFLDLADAMRSLGPALGEATDGLPTQEMTTGIRGLVGLLKSNLVVVGEQDEDAPKIVGRLDSEFVRELPEGEARIVGKVARRWEKGESFPLMALPGASLLGRKERRKMELDFDDNAVGGPAVSLDVLAIYR